jgi:hypothetical protein
MHSILLNASGVPASEPKCSAESAAIDEEKAALQAEYKQTHAAFDGKWISLRVSVSPRPQKAVMGRLFSMTDSRWQLPAGWS